MRRTTIINIIIFGILQMITIIYGLVIPKITIETYGSDINGLISSIKQFVSMMSILEFGVGSISTYALYKPVHEWNHDRISSVYVAIKFHYRVIGLIFSVALILISFLFPLLNQSINLDYFYIVLLFLIIGTSSLLEYFFIGKYRALIRAQNKEFIISAIQILVLILNFVISIYLINKQFDILLVYLFSSTVYFLRPMLYKIYIDKKFQINVKVKPDKNALSQKWDSFVHQISALIMSNIDIVVITIMFSFSFVSVYTIYLMIFMALSRIINILTNSLTNAFGKIISENNISRLRISYENIQYVIIVTSAIIYSSATILIKPFLILYTRNFSDSEIYVIPTLISLFIITEYIHKIKATQNIIVTASGNFKATKVSAIIETILNLIFTIIGAVFLGFYGVILGTLIALSYRLIDLIFFVSKKILYSKTIKSFVKIFANFVLVLFIVVINYSNDIIISKSYNLWFLHSIITVFSMFLFVCFFNFILFKKDFISTIKFVIGKRRI